jgi:hypothetical protein
MTGLTRKVSLLRDNDLALEIEASQNVLVRLGHRQQFAQSGCSSLVALASSRFGVVKADICVSLTRWFGHAGSLIRKLSNLHTL